MIDLDSIKKEQRRLQKRISLYDETLTIKKVAGCTSICTENKIIYVMVVLDYKTLEILESKYTIMRCGFPHIPGFLGYRQGPSAVETYHKLEIDPDVLIIEGTGIMHPRKIGVASHIGLLIDKPTIGISKSIIYGEKKKDTIYIDKEAVAKEIITKEHAKPIYVSPGNRIGLSRSLEVIRSVQKNHKLPEPLHIAHKLSVKIKKNIRS